MVEGVVGHVIELWRYPVKAMAGERLEQAALGWHGLAGDRRWAFVRPGLERSGFPWLTARERPDLLLHRPRLTDPDRPDASPVLVRTPNGADLDVLDPALASCFGEGVRVLKQDRGIFDAAPISLLTTSSLTGLAALTGSTLDTRRFRPNILVAPVGQASFAEDEWVGRELRIGAAQLRVDRRDPRCVVVAIDPEDTERDPTVLRAIARHRYACLGTYATPTMPEVVTVGDAVILL